ncbi:MAG TPA: excinuclease ABC subunit UvrC [bacterium]|nr:excinuclease ABC subunit UvrC [bacterium]
MVTTPHSPAIAPEPSPNGDLTESTPGTGLGEKLAALPEQPGVYLMKDGAGRVMYVGKATSLRSRVRQYFQPGHTDSPRILHLISKIRDVETVVCATEVEALILEATLIKRHHPWYNVRMADDKAYPYLKLTNEPYPKIVMTRKVARDGAKYFGPYPYHEPKLVGRTIRMIRRLFKLRTCNLEIDKTLPRPCLDHYIGQCSAPCVGWGASAEQYAEQVRQAGEFLEGKQETLIDSLRSQMDAAAKALDFERAAQLRDQLRGLEALGEKQRIVSAGAEDRDILALAQDGDEGCVQIFFVRAGRLVGQEHVMLQGTRGVRTAEALSAFMSQFYEASSAPPSEILVPEPIPDREVIERWLGERRGGRVVISQPQRGDRARLVAMARENASLHLFQERAGRGDQVGPGARELAQFLGLDTPPIRIECYDISNFQGGESVASLVVAEGGRLKKRDYRRFRMRYTEGPDDVAMMREVLQRRFAKARQEQERLDRDEPVPVKWAALPDLIVLDGGRGQLGAAREVLFEYNQSIPVIALAKQQELVYVPDLSEPRALPRDSQGLQLLQRIRDEAHRFANAYHQMLRQRRIVFSVLDEIPGIGERRKKALIRRFGSVRNIRTATVEEIASVEGIGPKVAGRIHTFLAEHPAPGGPS